MLIKKRILAVIQARGGSKGIPKKNIYPLNDHPLISYSIYAAKRSKYITDTIIFTDSQLITKVAKSYTAKSPIPRPAKLSGDKIFSVTSLAYAVKEYEKKLKLKFDYIIELPCVSPFRDAKDIDGSIKLMFEKNCDSVISMVGTGEKHPTRLKKIINGKIFDITKEFPEKNQNSRRQDLKPDSFIRNGAIYLMKRSTLLKKNSRSGKNSFGYIMDKNKSVNIDTIEDIQYAEFLMSKNKCDNKPEQIKVKSIEIFKKNTNVKVLISAPFHFLKNLKKKLIKNYHCTFEPNLPFKELKNLKLSEIKYWICSPCPNYKLSENVLKYFKNLNFILTPSTGTTHIDLNYCKKNNIKVFSIKSSKFIKNIYASSEFTFGLILSSIRKIPMAIDYVKKGNWRNVEDNLRSNEFKNKTLGIIGFGRIGSNCAKYAISMGMKVAAYDKKKIVLPKKIIKKKNIIQLVKSSDILLISVNLNSENINLINEKVFKNMKKNIHLINTSRGEVLNEKSLIKYLKNKKISTAAVDVVSNEQNNIKDNILFNYSLSNKNLIITPHIAGLTYESEEKAANECYKYLKKITNGTK